MWEGLLVLMAFNFGGVAACSRGAITWGCCKRLPLKVGNALEMGPWCTCLCHAAAHHVQPCARGWALVAACEDVPALQQGCVPATGCHVTDNPA